MVPLRQDSHLSGSYGPSGIFTTGAAQAETVQESSFAPEPEIIGTKGVQAQRRAQSADSAAFPVLDSQAQKQLEQACSSKPPAPSDLGNRVLPLGGEKVKQGHNILSKANPYKFVLEQKEVRKNLDIVVLVANAFDPKEYIATSKNGTCVITNKEGKLVELSDFKKAIKNEIEELENKIDKSPEGQDKNILMRRLAHAKNLKELVGSAKNTIIQEEKFTISTKDKHNLDGLQTCLEKHFRTNCTISFSRQISGGYVCTITRENKEGIQEPISLAEAREILISQKKEMQDVPTSDIDSMLQVLYKAQNKTGPVDNEFTLSDKTDVNKFKEKVDQVFQLKDKDIYLGTEDQKGLISTDKKSFKLLKKDGSPLTLPEFREKVRKEMEAGIDGAKELYDMLIKADNRNGKSDPQIELKKSDAAKLKEKGGSIESLVSDVFGERSIVAVKTGETGWSKLSSVGRSPIIKLIDLDGNPLTLSDIRTKANAKAEELKTKYEEALTTGDKDKIKEANDKYTKAKELSEIMENSNANISAAKKFGIKVSLGLGAIIFGAIALSLGAVPALLYGGYKGTKFVGKCIVYRAKRFGNVGFVNKDVKACFERLESSLKQGTKLKTEDGKVKGESFEAIYREFQTKWKNDPKMEQLNKLLRQDNKLLKKALEFAEVQGGLTSAKQVLFEGNVQKSDSEALTKDAEFIIKNGLFKKINKKIFEKMDKINFLPEVKKRELLKNMYVRSHDVQSSLNLLEHAMKTGRQDLVKELIKEQINPKNHVSIDSHYDQLHSNKTHAATLFAARLGSPFLEEILIPKEFQQQYKDFELLTPSEFRNLPEEKQIEYKHFEESFLKSIENHLAPINNKNGTTLLELAVAGGNIKFINLLQKAITEHRNNLIKELPKPPTTIPSALKEKLKALYPNAKTDEDLRTRLLRDQNRHPFLTPNKAGTRPIDIMRLRPDIAQDLDNLNGIDGQQIGSLSNAVAYLNLKQRWKSMGSEKRYALGLVGTKVAGGAISVLAGGFISIEGAVEAIKYGLVVAKQIKSSDREYSNNRVNELSTLAFDETILSIPLFTSTGIGLSIRQTIFNGILYLCNTRSIERRGLSLSLDQYKDGPAIPQEFSRIKETDPRPTFSDIDKSLRPSGGCANISQVADLMANASELELSPEQTTSLIDSLQKRIICFPNTEQGKNDRDIILNFLFKHCKTSDLMEKLFDTFIARGNNGKKVIDNFIKKQIDDKKDLTMDQYAAILSIAVKTGNIALFKTLTGDQIPKSCQNAAKEFMGEKHWVFFLNKDGETLEHLAMNSGNHEMLIEVGKKTNEIAPGKAFMLKNKKRGRVPFTTTHKNVQQKMTRQFANTMDEILNLDPSRLDSFTGKVSSQEFAQILHLVAKGELVIPFKILMGLAARAGIVACIAAALHAGPGIGFFMLAGLAYVGLSSTVSASAYATGVVAGKKTSNAIKKGLESLGGLEESVGQLGSTAKEIDFRLSQAQYKYLEKEDKIKTLREPIKQAMVDTTIEFIKEGLKGKKLTQFDKMENEMREILEGAFDPKKGVLENFKKMSDAVTRSGLIEDDLKYEILNLALELNLKLETEEFGQKFSSNLAIILDSTKDYVVTEIINMIKDTDLAEEDRNTVNELFKAYYDPKKDFSENLDTIIANKKNKIEINDSVKAFLEDIKNKGFKYDSKDNTLKFQQKHPTGLAASFIGKKPLSNEEATNIRSSVDKCLIGFRTEFEKQKNDHSGSELVLKYLDAHITEIDEFRIQLAEVIKQGESPNVIAGKLDTLFEKMVSEWSLSKEIHDNLKAEFKASLKDMKINARKKAH